MRLPVLELSDLLLQLFVLTNDSSLLRLLIFEYQLVLRFGLRQLCLGHLISIALFFNLILCKLLRFFDFVQLVPCLLFVALIVRYLLHQGLE